MYKFSFLFVFILFAHNAMAQFVYFPDPAFKASVLDQYWGYDLNSDQEIDSAEALLIDSVQCQLQNAFSISGIEAFPNLVYLQCGENNITSMDLSQNTLLQYVSANQNDLISINVAGCVNLTYLRLFWNYLPSIDVSTCLNLEYLDITGNSVDSLDLSNNPSLNALDCSVNGMVYLNVKNNNNVNFTHLFAGANYLDCITVDDAIYSEVNWIGNDYLFDSTVVFSNDCSTLGFEEGIESIHFNLSPNPFSDRIQIEVNEETQYTVYNIHGTMMQNGNLEAGTNLINAENWMAGIYFIQLQNKMHLHNLKRIEKL